MRSIYEQRIVDTFLSIYNQHQNPVWAYNTLEHMIFTQHKDEFYKLPDNVQWEIRNIMTAIKLLFV
jgi:hypothetical protein